MTHHDAFLQAVLEKPDDDTPRLIYADWLSDHDDPRGDFIRVQCRLASAPADDPRRPEWEAHEGELLRRHQDEWLGGLRPLATRWVFRRGFLDAVTLPLRIVLDGGGPPRPVTVRRVEADLSDVTVAPEVLDLFPVSVAHENCVLLLEVRQTGLLLAMRDPDDLELCQKLQFVMNRDIAPVAAPADQIAAAIVRHYGPPETWPHLIPNIPEFVDVALDFGHDTERQSPESDWPIVRLSNLILQEAIALRATEVRIEPATDHFRVRYRIDGRWTERDRPPRRILEPVVTRLRLMAGIAVSGAGPQRGRIPLNLDGRRIDPRVTIRQTALGPGVLLRF
jgi:uncharacterized protein (TIGR02996 family)